MHDNLARMRAFLNRFQSGDWDGACTEFCHPDFEIREPPGLPQSGIHRGQRAPIDVSDILPRHLGNRDRRTVAVGGAGRRPGLFPLRHEVDEPGDGQNPDSAGSGTQPLPGRQAGRHGGVHVGPDRLVGDIGRRLTARRPDPAGQRQADSLNMC